MSTVLDYVAATNTLTVSDNGTVVNVAGSGVDNNFSVPQTFQAGITASGSTSLQAVSGTTGTFTGAVSAATATSGNQLVNYTQLTNGSFSPKFGLLQRQIQQNNQNWLPNSSYLYGFAGWNNGAGLDTANDSNFTYAIYSGTDTSTQYLTSENLTADSILNSGITINLSGWIYNVAASASATLALNCYNSSNTLLGTIASSSVSIGNGWTYVTNSGAVPSGTAYVQVVCGFAGASSGTNIAFSQIKLENGNIATPWSDDSSTDLFQRGTFQPNFSSVMIDSSTTTNAPTSGSVTLAMPLQGSGGKQVILTFDAYENDTTTAQTINFPTAFLVAPLVIGNNTGLTLTPSTTGVTITAPDSTTTYSGTAVIMGN